MVKLKGNKIVISTEKDLDEIESKMAQIQMEYLPFVVLTLTTLLNQYIIDPIQNKMRQAGVSQKVIERTFLDTRIEQQGKSIIFHVVSDYHSDSGFAVAKMIESGRRAYIVKPTYKKFLSWIKDGIRKYSRESHIPEKQALHAIHDTIITNQQKVQKELNNRTKKWISGILKS